MVDFDLWSSGINVEDLQQLGVDFKAGAQVSTQAHKAEWTNGPKTTNRYLNPRNGALETYQSIHHKNIQESSVTC